MKKKLLVLSLLSSTLSIYAVQNEEQKSSINPEKKGTFNDQKVYQVAVVGAGPAGVTAMGVLRKSKIRPQDLMWIDPRFELGRFGEWYDEVPSNTVAKGFLQYLKSCSSFPCGLGEIGHPLEMTDQDKWCPLKFIIDPLKLITACFRQDSPSIEGSVTALSRHTDGSWKLEVNNSETILATKVILAIGAFPRSLNYEGPTEIPMDVAMKPSVLKDYVTAEDSIAVFGNGSSGVLATKNVLDLGVKKIIIFYKDQLRYMTRKQERADIGGFTMAGLESFTKKWAKLFLEKDTPENIIQVQATEENIKKYLPACSKVIYAIGFTRNPFPGPEENPTLTYNSSTGVIAPNLFGIGIAFPKIDRTNADSPMRFVGLNPFMQHAEQNMPLWLSDQSQDRE